MAPPSATHGPSHACVNGGGRSACRMAPAPTSAAIKPRKTRNGLPSAPTTQRPASQQAIPTAAAAAAISDHRSGEYPHPPNLPDPTPNVVQGSAPPTRAVRNPRPIRYMPGAVLRPGSRSCAGARAPRTSDKHSPPRTRPRTGTAQERQSPRPHTSQSATASRCGCAWHRNCGIDHSDTASEAYAALRVRARVALLHVHGRSQVQVHPDQHQGPEHDAQNGGDPRLQPGEMPEVVVSLGHEDADGHVHDGDDRSHGRWIPTGCLGQPRARLTSSRGRP